jgi:hypothetical protein
MLCRKLRDTITLDRYTSTQAAQLKISGYKIIGVRINNRNGRVSAAVSMQMTQEQTGAEFNQTIPLIKEDGRWRICE